ncbi:hypothetical protein CPB84DRAFT_1772329 [Gymnopilus junonius]|uniref:PX domain-containing protein n=1 Tax=Gymnopilus junonius TaxID=109634 RepID=A0A9P5NQC5_GYMJU|nr:hypothetical protein CPB84DRAFT_1772329 [Gymnopilus junonius]
MRITPVMTDDSASLSSRSSRGSQTEYEVWRRWEDCLWLQETLESEYGRAAREKKVRLQQGKGVKNFNGIYKTDMASSWESLPPGPDPNSVAQDIHQHLPKLSKKGTLFRASQSTIENRQKEFRNLVETLFSDSMPALIQEIRASNIVTDFFGLWRRDFDLLESSEKGRRNSLTTSVFTSYFSESSPALTSKSPERSLRSLPNSPAKHPSRQRTSSERCRSPSQSTSDVSEVSRYPASSRTSTHSTATNATHKPRRRALSVTSSDSSSTHSDGSSDSGWTSSTTPAIVEDVPIQENDRPSSILEVLPEERELLAKSSDGHLAVPIQRRSRASTVERKANRSCQIVGLPPDRQSTPDQRRESWQTVSSLDSNVNVLLEGLEISLPHPIKEGKFRASIASISTFMTTDSAEAVIPQASSKDRQSTQSRLRISTPLSISDFSIYTDADDDCNSIIDAFPRPVSYMPQMSVNRLGTLLVNQDADLPSSPESTRTSSDPPPSPTNTVSTSISISTTAASISTMATSDSSPGSLAIKAALGSSIIMLRVPREISLSDVRQRLYNKFVGQEGIPLSQSFSVAFMLSASQSSPEKQRSRSASVSSFDKQELVFVDSDSEWHSLVSSSPSSKISLRIFDSSH